MGTTTAIPAEIIVDLQQAAELAAKGIRDPEAMRQACKDMDRRREQIFARQGILDIGLAAIRELRDT
ncbi:MAG TPA: hypothetical protein VFI31_02245 [Pirellulales bacterium]|nr:hypothetical protein [Pirellulales bacterium]